MTTNEKREPPLSVGFDIVQELIKREGTRATIETRFWLANRITEAVNAARTASGDALRQAYDAGYQAESEAVGDEVADEMQTAAYQDKRREDLASLAE